MLMNNNKKLSVFDNFIIIYYIIHYFPPIFLRLIFSFKAAFSSKAPKRAEVASFDLVKTIFSAIISPFSYCGG